MEARVTTFTVDDKSYTVETRGKNLLEVCLGLGLNIPYFCWHPVFRSVGACRQCAVKVFMDAKDNRGSIEMSCMTPVKDGMRVFINDPEALAFRARIIEWLMVNHPHDCPVCDEGGECHLQDMTVMTGHVYRTHRFPKRTHRDQNLGPFVNMEMNRCIQCYRCVRFYRDYAGGRDFDVMGWHDHVYFGRHEDGALESEFSGNLVEVCPTGVFTDKSLKKHYTRKWDLQTAPSICVHCGLGCNTIAGERYGTLRRVMPRYSEKVNGYFLCDRGRYGYGFVNSGKRIRQPLIRDAESQSTTSSTLALARISELLRSGNVIGIGSPRASIESNFALRALVGAERFFYGMPESEMRIISSMVEMIRSGPVITPSLREVESCDSVFILGEDVTNSAPMLDLALRQSVLQKPMIEAMKLGIHDWLNECLREAMQDERGPLFIAAPYQTKLDSIATAAYRAAPDDIARLGFAVAHIIDPNAAAVPGLTPLLEAQAKAIAAGLGSGRKPLVVSGTSCRSEAVVHAAGSIARALHAAGTDVRLCFTVPECNSMGAALLPAGGIESALAELRKGSAATVIILENDIFRTLDAASAQTIFSNTHVIAIDHMSTATTGRAEVVLPAAAFPEASGTLVNNEGRAQRLFQVFVPSAPIEASWRWISKMMPILRKKADPWPTLDSLLAEIAADIPVFAPIRDIAPPAGFRLLEQKIPRQSARYSGRTAISANVTIHEPKPPEDRDAPMSFSMEGSPRQPPSALIARFWAPQWNSVQAINKFQNEIAGTLRGGDCGRRLIEPSPLPRASAPTVIPPAFAPRLDAFLFVPAYHIFGSDECSAVADEVTRNISPAYVGFATVDANRFGIVEGQIVAVSVGNEILRLTAKLNASLPAGIAALPFGLPGLHAANLPAWGTLDNLSTSEEQRGARQ